MEGGCLKIFGSTSSIAPASEMTNKSASSDLARNEQVHESITCRFSAD